MAIDPTEPESLRLIRGAQQGQSIAWRGLDARYRERLTALAAFLLGPKTQRYVSPDDLVQDAWAGVIEKFSSFEYRGVGSLYALLALRLRQLAADKGRRAKVRSVEETLDPEAPPLIGNNATPSRILAESERSERIAQNLLDEQFPRTQAKAIIGFHLEGRAGRDVAQELKIPFGVFHKHVHRARQRYRELFGDDLEALL